MLSFRYRHVCGRYTGLDISINIGRLWSFKTNVRMCVYKVYIRRAFHLTAQSTNMYFSHINLNKLLFCRGVWWFVRPSLRICLLLRLCTGSTEETCRICTVNMIIFHFHPCKRPPWTLWIPQRGGETLSCSVKKTAANAKKN